MNNNIDFAQTLQDNGMLICSFLLENQRLQEKLNSSQLENELYKKRCAQYSQSYDSLIDQLIEMKRSRFGKKSERFIEDSKSQLSLFPSDNDALARAQANNILNSEENIDNPNVLVSSYTRKKHKKIDKEIPVRIELISVNDENKQCSCGSCKEVIRHEIKRLLHHQPAVFEIIEQRREVVACPNKNCESNNKIITASAPLQVLPKIKATEEFLSFLVVSKCDDRQPLYHLEKQLAERYGVDCSRQTLSRWVIDLMAPLQPIYNLLKDELIDYDIASCDATTLQVLKEKDRAPETKSYVYCMRGGPPEKSVILYDYNDREHKQFVKDWFEGFKGYLHVDGDNFFKEAGDDIVLVNCNGHSRRKFEPITKKTKGNGLAQEAMRFYKALYKIEREAKDNHYTPDQRYQLRQEKSKPLLDKFKAWLDELYPTTLPQSSLGKAMNYCFNIWPGLTRFLEDGRLEIDNNLTEQEIKPFVIARKNFLFCDSVDGANALCMHFGLIRTAKRHGLDPYHYYVKLLKSIPYCKSVEDYEKLLPWNIRLDYARSE